MTNFLYQHHKNTIRTININNLWLEKGMIVKMRYRADSHKKILKEYIILILNRNWKQKIHALSLEHIPEKTFIKMGEEFGIVYAKNIIKYKKINIPKLLMELSSHRVYHRKLKPYIKTEYNSSYRTFTLKNVISLQLVDYDFGIDITKTYKL